MPVLVRPAMSQRVRHFFDQALVAPRETCNSAHKAAYRVSRAPQRQSHCAAKERSRLHRGGLELPIIGK
jgi:hypothetical protein